VDFLFALEPIYSMERTPLGERLEFTMTMLAIMMTILILIPILWVCPSCCKRCKSCCSRLKRKREAQKSKAKDKNVIRESTNDAMETGSHCSESSGSIEEDIEMNELGNQSELSQNNRTSLHRNDSFDSVISSASQNEDSASVSSELGGTSYSNLETKKIITISVRQSIKKVMKQKEKAANSKDWVSTSTNKKQGLITWCVDSQEQITHRLAISLIFGIMFLHVFFVAGFPIASAVNGFLFEPSAVQIALLNFPIMAFMLTCLSLVVCVYVWSKCYWTLYERLLFSVMILVSVVMVPWYVNYNLFGFRKLNHL